MYQMRVAAGRNSPEVELVDDDRVPPLTVAPALVGCVPVFPLASQS